VMVKLSTVQPGMMKRILATDDCGNTHVMVNESSLHVTVAWHRVHDSRS
jgi:hypothetical protein